MIREIDALGGREELDRIVGFDYDYPPDRLRGQLLPVRDRLRQEAKDRGWEAR